MAAAVNITLAVLVSKVVVQEQRGCVRGRNILDNVLEREGVALLGLSHKTTAQVMVAIDVEAAFPSLDRRLMWHVCEA